MIKIAVVSTKGGTGKTTVTANLGGVLADSGYRVLLIDADPQPTLSSYFRINYHARQGLTEFLLESSAEQAISQTTIERLNIIVSNDPQAKLRDWVRDTPDGRVRLRFLLEKLGRAYDFALIDTQGAEGPVQDAAVVAADIMLSPIPPEMLAAREFFRGTLGMIKRLQSMSTMGITIAPLRGVLNRVDRTLDAGRIVESLRQSDFTDGTGEVSLLNTMIPNAVAYREAASLKLPVHRHDGVRKNKTPCASEVICSLARELIPNLPALTETQELSVKSA